MQRIHFQLMLNAEQCRRYYSGQVRFVQVEADDGRIVRFPVSAIQPYLEHSGVQGRFCLEFDDNHKFSALKKIK